MSRRGGQIGFGRDSIWHRHPRRFELVPVLQGHNPSIVRVEDLVKVRHQQRKHPRRNPQRRRKNNTHIPRRHLVNIRIINNLNQVRRQCPQKRVVGLGQACYQSSQLIYSVCPI